MNLDRFRGPYWGGGGGGGGKPNIAHMAFKSDFWRRFGVTGHNNER